jgi:hypothetical protein
MPVAILQLYNQKPVQASMTYISELKAKVWTDISSQKIL